MRNPMNSWDKSDSGICKGGDDGIGCENCAKEVPCEHTYDHSLCTLIIIGSNSYFSYFASVPTPRRTKYNTRKIFANEYIDNRNAWLPSKEVADILYLCDGKQCGDSCLCAGGTIFYITHRQFSLSLCNFTSIAFCKSSGLTSKMDSRKDKQI